MGGRRVQGAEVEMEGYCTQPVLITDKLLLTEIERLADAKNGRSDDAMGKRRSCDRCLDIE